MKHHAIAIDGPSGAGKSTMAKAAAKKLGYLYVDTGAIYRTVGYHMWLMGIGPKDADGIRAADRRCEHCHRPIADGVQHMILNGMDVTARARTRREPLRLGRVGAAVRAGIFALTCSGSSRGSTTSSWTGATSGRSFCRAQT